MSASLLETARRRADSHARKAGSETTTLPGLRVVRIVSARELLPQVDRPTMCLVLQGAMKVGAAQQTIEARSGESVLLIPDVPSITEVTRATLVEPYLALLVELDSAVITNLMTDIHAASLLDGRSDLEDTDEDVVSAASRLLGLLTHPESVPLLLHPLIRELHYWLLIGRHGLVVRGLTRHDSAAQRVARAVALIKAEFANSLRIDRLAGVAGMSTSAFHEHFRAVTSMTPLQFQKQLRLIESRRLMLSVGKTASSAAFAVGYQSVSQFNRDYRRMFGLPPVRETKLAKEAATQHLHKTLASKAKYMPVGWSHIGHEGFTGGAIMPAT